MRYRIVIEIDTDAERTSVNRLALEMRLMAVNSWSVPIYCATEVVNDKERNIQYEKD